MRWQGRQRRQEYRDFVEAAVTAGLRSFDVTLISEFSLDPLLEDRLGTGLSLTIVWVTTCARTKRLR